MKHHQHKESGGLDQIADARTNQGSRAPSAEPERAAAHKSEMFSACFADAALGLSITDLDGRFLEVNQAYCAITGYSEDELRGLDLQAITHPEDLSETMSNLRALISGKIPAFVMEKRYIRKDGIVLWIQSSVSLTRGPDGQPLNLVLINQDISARKHLEDELRSAKEFSEQLIETANAIILGLDTLGNIRLFNRAAEEITGYTFSELKGRNWFETLAPRDRYPQVWEEFIRLLAGGEPQAFENPILTKSGEERHILWHNNQIVVDGMVVATISFGTDITEGRKMHDALRLTEKKYRNIFENVGEGIFQTTPEGGYLSANPALARIHGFDSPEELIRNRTDIAREIYVDPGRRTEFQRLLQEHGFVRGFEHQMFRKDGSKIWISVNARAVSDERGAILYYEGTTQDISERKLAEARLKQSESQLAEAQRQAHLGSWTRDLDSDEVFLSDELFRLFGMKPQQAGTTYESFLQRVQPEDRTRARTMRLEAIRAREPRDYEYRIAHPEKGERILHERITVTRNEETGKDRLFGTTQDVTERKLAERALRESEELFSKAFHSSPGPLIITRLADGRFLNVNDAFLRAFGYQRAEVIGETVKSLNIYIHPNDRKNLIDQLQDHRALRGYESQARTKSGHILDLLVFVEPVTLKGEQCLLSTAYDITDRKRVEAALRESEERYRELFENAKDAIYVHDLSGRYTSVNRAAEQLSGFPREEIIGKHFSNFMAPRHLKYARTNLVKKLDEVPETTYEVDLVTKDRRRVPVEVNSRLVYQNGVAVGVQGTARDITERKRAEEARAQLALIVESSDDAIIGKTLDGIILSWNSGAEKIYGYQAEEVIGRPMSMLLPPERHDDLPQILSRLRLGESIRHYETTRCKKDGNVIDVSLTISPIRDSLQNVVGASEIARDITPSKEAEKALKTFSRRLIEAQEAERQSIARELHDEIGQVLTAVRINLHSIQRAGGADRNSARLDESIAVVDDALGRVSELSLELRPSLLDDLGLSTALHWYVDRYAQRTGIIAEVLNGFEEDGRLPRELETACFRIAQEALTNIARHAQAGSVSVQLERSRESMLLTVMDDGVGFDVDELRKNALAAAALGLRGMEERAHAVGGQLEIDSGRGRGTIVRASFPLIHKVA